ncbi:hypothetical protein [Sphaerotilus mobilis]|uniref:Uncharacterized protein n=1 Tax=Sphaerotilus mobilis TaxID=47994 RepID=A0A4Q7LGP7_9BURK|nr:hypothetical protein [Sphaerotilus mobilis]RZS53404.1 hypothetical protein EV685_3032 [Sphaerotilus mobilis]
MSNCCGAKRASLAIGSGTEPVPRPVAGSDIRMRLDRPLDLTLRGETTGRDYHFTPHVPTLLVAATDVESLLRYGGVAREA